MLLRDEVVYRVDLFTTLDLATMTILFGKPSSLLYTRSTLFDQLSHTGVASFFERRAVYQAYDLEIASSGRCPMTIQDQWSLPTQISIPALADHPGYSTAESNAIILMSEDCR